MSEIPSISVVLPVYNGMRFLGDCLSSILSQECGDFELIAVDDGSTDGSAAWLSQIDDPRVHFVPNPRNLGIFPSLNRGFHHARAPYVQIFCQDDVMLPHCLARQKAWHEQHPQAAMVWCHFRDVDENGEVLGEDRPPQYQSRLAGCITPDASAAYFAVYGCMPGNISPVMLKRQAFLEVGDFSDGLRYVGDFDYWIRLATRYAVCYNPETLMQVRTHPERASYALNRDLELIAEESPLLAELIRQATPPGRSRRQLRKLLARVRGIQYIDWTLRAACKGKLRTALAALPRIHRSLGLWRCLLLYGLSLNGRRLPPARERVLDLLLREAERRD